MLPVSAGDVKAFDEMSPVGKADQKSSTPFFWQGEPSQASLSLYWPKSFLFLLGSTWCSEESFWGRVFKWGKRELNSQSSGRLPTHLRSFCLFCIYPGHHMRLYNGGSEEKTITVLQNSQRKAAKMSSLNFSWAKHSLPIIRDLQCSVDPPNSCSPHCTFRSIAFLMERVRNELPLRNS